ncbi:unnamed protein product [Arabis nemorensis]|uniref:Uncharacterized protein n=1 Tax=Arabis nemorensis TaxID=586526 RepID=A0A565BF35_9BRAS|nr:unnamed protein product [Arabis nemorensis]
MNLVAQGQMVKFESKIGLLDSKGDFTYPQIMDLALFQRKRQSQGTCDFAHTTIVSASNSSESLTNLSVFIH